MYNTESLLYTDKDCLTLSPGSVKALGSKHLLEHFEGSINILLMNCTVNSRSTSLPQ